MIFKLFNVATSISDIC